MIDKRNLKNKYVDFMDKDGKMRTQRVVRIDGNFLTVINAVGVKTRVYKDRVRGRRFRKSGLEPIDWSKKPRGGP